MVANTNSQEQGRFNLGERMIGMLRRLLRSDEAGVTIAFLMMCLLLATTTTTFMSPFNLLEVSRQASYVGIIVVGAVFVLSMGDVDLSVGSTFFLAIMTCGYAMRAGVNVWVSVLIGLATGGLCGLVNGGLSVLLRIPTIIVTLGTMSIYRGLGLVICQGRTIYEFPKEGFLFDVIGRRIGPVPGGTVVFLITVALGYVLYSKTPFGRRVCAIGSNLEASRFSGIRIVKHRLLVMVLQGVLAAVSGIVAMAFLKSCDPSYGEGYELLVIAAAIIGGTSLAGGAGTILGGFIGALIISVIRNGLVLLGVTIYWTPVATGSVIIAAVALDYFIKRRA